MVTVRLCRRFAKIAALRQRVEELERENADALARVAMWQREAGSAQAEADRAEKAHAYSEASYKLLEAEVKRLEGLILFADNDSTTAGDLAIEAEAERIREREALNA